MLDMLLLLADTVNLGVLSIPEINYVTTKGVEPQELHAITPLEAKEVKSYFSTNLCRYTGVAVPFERDWEEIDENRFTHSRTVNPPQPGKIFSYAIVLNKKTCPGKEPEHMLRTGTWMGAFKNLGVPEGIMFKGFSLSNDEKSQPKWLPQVDKILLDASATNPVAKDFMSFNAGALPQGKQDAPQPQSAEQSKKAD